ncbi:heparinase II/III family protein [Paenibacillus hodogayensis]|uniref:Heparinase II/III family protein n=1 Tax=Paenibacillus hodogayensis TaxID=279208 RepID=A0ABV5VXT1_9BACL
MLMERYGQADLEELLLPPERIAPFPKAGDRSAWDSLPQGTRERWIGLAETYADYAWPAIRADDYRGYWTTGNLSRHMDAVFERRSVLGMLTVAECMEGQGRFLGQIVNGIMAVCEETTWVPPLHRLHTKRNMDECMPDPSDHRVELVTATTTELLAWIHYLLEEPLEAISARIRRRIEREVRARTLEPYMAYDDYWWMGFVEGARVNNWNPWCNGGALMGYLLMERDAAERARAVRKIMRSLDAFIFTYSPDGCCDEGPMYWGASGGGLYGCLELLGEASGGRIDVFAEPLVKDIGAYIYKAHISGDYFAAFADGDAKAGIEGDVIYRYGKSIGDERLMQFGASRGAGGPVIYSWFGLYGHLRNLFQEREREALGAKAPCVRDAWFPHTQVMTAREREGSEQGLYIAAKGGHNLESHNHNDVGSFIVFADGCPLFVDLGTEEYKAKTFGPDRYELWYVQSKYHNLPTIGGVLQRNGKTYRAKDAMYRQDDAAAQLSLDIAEAYPEEAGLLSWRRTFKLARGVGPHLAITDDFSLAEPPGSVEYSWMTPCEPRSPAPGRFRFEYAAGRWAELEYDAAALDAHCEKIDWMDDRLKGNWGERMYRLVLAERQPVAQASRTFTVRAGRSP